MWIEISGHQIDVTPALRDYVQTKLERIGRHFDHHLNVEVILSVEKLDHQAEATLVTPRKTLFADAVAEDMYAAIDLLADKLERILQRQKEKMTDHHRGSDLVSSGSLG